MATGAWLWDNLTVMGVKMTQEYTEMVDKDRYIASVVGKDILQCIEQLQLRCKIKQGVSEQPRIEGDMVHLSVFVLPMLRQCMSVE